MFGIVFQFCFSVIAAVVFRCCCSCFLKSRNVCGRGYQTLHATHSSFVMVSEAATGEPLREGVEHISWACPSLQLPSETELNCVRAWFRTCAMT